MPSLPSTQRRLALLALFVFAALACTRGAGGPPSGAPALPVADWTLLVYMAADDDLEQAALDNVREMALAGSSEHVHVVVQIDRAPPDRTTGGFSRTPLLNLPDFSSTKRLRVALGKVDEIVDLGETCTCDPAPLAAFIAWGLQAFPARKTALVLWDHGGATHGFGWDVTSENRGLSIVDIRRGISAGLAAAGRERFDLLGFDACLMSNLGVAFELRHLADIFIGSEEVEPSIGWAYEPVVRAMAADASPTALAREVVRTFAAACRQTGAWDMATLAAFETKKLDAVVAALDGLGARLQSRTLAAVDWYKISAARVAAEQYGAGGGQQTPYATVDLVDFTSSVAHRLGEKNQVAQAVSDATIFPLQGGVAHGPGRPNAHGLSMTFPRQSKERRVEDDALELATRRGPWDQFVDEYLARASADRTAPTILGLEAASSPDVVEVLARVPAADVAEVAAFVGVNDGSEQLEVRSITILPGPDPEPPADVYRWIWNKRLPAIGYDGRSLPVTVFEEPPYTDETGALVRIASVNGVLYRDGDVARGTEVSVHFKLPTGAVHPVAVSVYRFEGGGSGSEVTIHGGDTFAPSVLAVGRDGRRTWTPSKVAVPFSAPSRLTLESEQAPARAYAIGLRATDYAANVQWNMASATVP